MKVFILKPKCPEAYLEIKSINFTERRRERVRKHVQKVNSSKLVWFEDEEPPNSAIEAIEREFDDPPTDQDHRGAN